MHVSDQRLMFKLHMLHSQNSTVKTQTTQCLKKTSIGSSCCGSVVRNPTSIHEDAGLILGQWVKDPALLWLWCRQAAAALIQPLAGEPSYAAGVALKKKEKKSSNSPPNRQISI